jgi:hypothetical protein
MTMPTYPPNPNDGYNNYMYAGQTSTSSQTPSQIYTQENGTLSHYPQQQPSMSSTTTTVNQTATMTSGRTANYNDPPVRKTANVVNLFDIYCFLDDDWANEQCH